MINANILNITKADAVEYTPGEITAFGAVKLHTEQGTATLFLPSGTAAAVAAAINVAVGAGAVNAGEVAA